MENNKNVNDFAKNFKKNIDLMGMPDFRKMGIGLRQDIDNLEEKKVKGEGVKKITVSTTAPTNPNVGDLWVDIS